jgi:hypothetical protein
MSTQTTISPFTKPRLSDEQVAQYRDEGYLIYAHEVLPAEKFQKLKDHFEQKLAALPPDIRPESMDVPHFTDPALFEWLFADEVLDLVEPITGPDIALFSSHFICKPKGDGKRVPWHEDSAYWRNRVTPMEIVTLWLAIDPSTPENGGMSVIPRTHREAHAGYSDYEAVDATQNVFVNEIIKPQRDESRAVPCILQPNQASLHDARIMHGSPANTSSIRRCGYTMRYMSSACRLTEEQRDYHQIYLARGRDLANQPYGDPNKSHQDLMSERVRRGQRGH